MNPIKRTALILLGILGLLSVAISVATLIVVSLFNIFSGIIG